MASTYQEYKDALCSSDEIYGSLILDRAADDYSISLAEFLSLVTLFDSLFPKL